MAKPTADYTEKSLSRFHRLLRLFHDGWREKARKELATLQSFHDGERQRMAREVEAIGYDLPDPQRYSRPYTAHESTTTYNAGGGFLGGAVAALAAAGLGAGGVWWLLTQHPTQPSPQPPPGIDRDVRDDVRYIPPES